MWHIQTLRFSISDHQVSDHNDPNDVLYWQLLGTSYWKMNKDKTYKMEPGDLLYFNKEDSHEVLQDGPRAGIIIDNIGQRYIA
jgi:ribosomal protein L16 Arg81 hydroxylase